MSLEGTIETRSRRIKTDGYAMSIGEVTSMYRDRDLEIHPEFQRVFRWEPKQKSRLIESILLGIPVPPIFVSQRSDGRWDVVDGVQRLSTIFEFMGVYHDADGNRTTPSVLESTEYLPTLGGCVWNASFLGRPGASQALSETLQRDFKRSRLDFRIILEESDDNATHDLFHRLNAGSQPSRQEVRDCLLVMLNVSLYETVLRLSRDAGFLSCTPLPETTEDHAYRHELVLRFFAQVDDEGGEQGLDQEHGEYVTQWMRAAAARFGSPESPVDDDLFRRTFRLLDRATGEDTFTRWDPTTDRHRGAFSISSYEFIATGVAHHVSAWEGRTPDALAARIRESWQSDALRDGDVAGVGTRRRFPEPVLAARDYFRP